MPRIKLSTTDLYNQPDRDIMVDEISPAFDNAEPFYNQLQSIRGGQMRSLGNQLGGFFDVISDPKSYIQELTQSVESSVSDWAQEALPENLYEQASALAAKTGTQIEQKAGDLMSKELSQYAQQKNVQDQAITTGVQAAANRVGQTMINVKDVYRTGGVGAVYKAYPTPFWIAGGFTALLTARFILGGRRNRVIYAAPATARANPGKRRKKR